jgi:hypothetical protein
MRVSFITKRRITDETTVTDWNWLATPGNIGEVPIEVTADGTIQILPGYAEGFELGEREFVTDKTLHTGDVCILTCEIIAVDESAPTTIAIEVHEVEFIHRATESRDQIESMLSHLEDAKQTHQQRRAEATCSNCRTIDQTTAVRAHDDRQDRDLHYCGECGRLLSTTEYETWKDVSGI